MDKKNLSERNICTKYITPAILRAGWSQNQLREEVKLTDSRVMVRGTLAARINNPDAKGGPKHADYVLLYARPNLPKDLVVPVPPIEEQRITVKKLKRLLGLCDQLEKPLTKTQRTAERLAQAAVAAITGTQFKDKETMKAPKTELVTQLKLKTSPGKKDQAPLAAILAKHNGELPAKGLWHYPGLTVDGFYQQLKTEMARGWIDEPEKARGVVKAAATESAEVA